MIMMPQQPKLFIVIPLIFNILKNDDDYDDNSVIDIIEKAIDPFGIHKKIVSTIQEIFD